MIGSLSHLIREAAITAIADNTERITEKLLDGIELDIRAQQQLLAPAQTRRGSAGRDGRNR